MLAFTPEVERALDWFQWTHTLTEHGWERTTLPCLGGRDGLAQQDARLMVLLEEIRVQANASLHERIDDERRTRSIAAWRDERDRAFQN